jgi:Mrp family chromosome partitioning ATPase
MTILEALEKAKLLRQQQQQAQDSPAQAARRVRSAANPVTVQAAARLNYTVHVPDPVALRANRVLLTADVRPSAASDAYRILRTRLMHRIESNGWNSFAVTSAGPGEGKSLTVLNLGLAIASERRRNVYLLDLDLRNPSLCRYLGVRTDTGIGQYLAGDGTIENLFFSIGVDNLAVAGGMSTHENSAELLGSERLGELLDHIRQTDPGALILADLPPLLSVADALVVAPRMSATLLVVAEGRTRRDGLARALEVLSGVTLAGIALNHSSAAIQNYYA